MSENVQRRLPWLGIVALAIAAGLLGVLRFLSTPEGAHWVEDFFRPLGYAAILVGVAGPLAFLGLAGLVVALAGAGAVRGEPFGVGELAVTMLLSLFAQAASSHAELWGPYPQRLLWAGVVVFGGSFGGRWIWDRIKTKYRRG